MFIPTTQVGSRTNMVVPTRRLRTLANGAFANAVTIFIALFFGWTLPEATFAYVGELIIVVVLAFARILAATEYPSVISRFRFRFAQAVAIVLTSVMYGLAVLLMLLMIFGQRL